MPHFILAALLNYPRLLCSVMRLARPTLHRLLVCADSRHVVASERYQFIDAQIGVIPKLNAKGKVIVSPSHLPIEEQTKNIVNLTPAAWNTTPVASVDSL